MAEDVENLQEGQKISVTIAGTSYYRNQLVVERQTERMSVPEKSVSSAIRLSRMTGN